MNLRRRRAGRERKGFMKISEIISPSGSYDHMQFRLIERVTTTLMVMTLFLLTINIFFLILVIPVETLLYYIWIISTIKRLHGVGRPATDAFKLLIPFVSWKIEKELRNEQGYEKDEEITEEGFKETMKDYQIQEYERERRRSKRTDDY